MQATPLAAPVPRPWSWRIPYRLALRWLVRLVVFLVLGNLLIHSASWAAQALVDPGRVEGVAGVDNLRAVDAEVWRGGKPTREGYRGLAAAGVTVVVDLRAEDAATADDAFIQGLGLEVVHLPIRDGQTPSPDDVQQFLAVVRNSPGRVFVHCGAGVGRAGAMAAGYLAETGQTDAGARVGRNLAVGPPSLEQLVFAANGGDEPDALVKAVSRTLDGPRRLWHRL